MSNRLAELRKEKGLTLDQIQEQTGINRVTFGQYERGKREPKLATWQKLADFFDVSVGYLQGFTANRMPAEQIIEYYEKLKNALDTMDDASFEVTQGSSKQALKEVGNFLAIVEKLEDRTLFSATLSFLNDAFLDLTTALITNVSDEIRKSDYSRIVKDLNYIFSIIEEERTKNK